VGGLFGEKKKFCERIFDENGDLDMRIDKIWQEMDNNMPVMVNLIKKLVTSSSKRNKYKGKIDHF